MTHHIAVNIMASLVPLSLAVQVAELRKTLWARRNNFYLDRPLSYGGSQKKF
jgi:hypothetical protein